MAHTTTVHGVHFIHDAFALSGTVTLRMEGDKGEIYIPMQALTGFVAEAVRAHRTRQLEQMSDADLLGLSEPPRSR